MGYSLKLKASALVLCGGLAMVLASACDLTYNCDTVEPGSAGAGYPTESVGAGDYPNNDEEDEPEDDDVGSAQLAMAGGCSPVHPCTEMYEKCEDKRGRCTREIDSGRTLCDYCRDDCQNKRPYKYSECYQCGFY
ncbi:uncharacterized protein SOCE836_084440 [Sorangium cellulosum]|uniref:Secreted protein n=1 Tax=Sorangium cellulosum TaxID=56 RepID=A0A4P2R018_SORCE|nr:uncharacterized protein SOCE836_084440 [Sorangium cellulosum]WCQ95539.1 hypothetical protein NQZ70_08316 [Sorangium sp. Soce836]